MYGMRVSGLVTSSQISGFGLHSFVEIKAVQVLCIAHELQLVNYLTAARIDDGLLINFDPSVQVRRKFRQFRPKATPVNLPTR
jgi:PD-(D/E)XK nuclease superfamily